MKKLLKIHDVTEIVSLSAATIYRMIKRKQFPASVKISDGAVRWRLTEIDEWIAALY